MVKSKLKGNQNAKKGKHPSQVLRLPVELVDGLYECLALEGEIITEDDPDRINEHALDVLSDHVRHRIEEGKAIIL